MNSDTAVGCLALVVTAAIMGVMFLLSGLHYDTTGAGNHTGYVTAVQQSGIFFRNWAVYIKTDNSSSQEDRYCVQEGDEPLVDELKQVSKERKLITINFEGVKGFGWNLCRHQRITSVEIH